MPIPPRPIPTPSAYHRRTAPRTSPPLITTGRKGEAFMAESRAEMALLPGLTVGSTPNSLRGVRLMHTPPAMGVAIGGSSAPSTRPGTPLSAARPHDVPLASLMDGRGRPKRVGAASQLGFDFVARPTVLAMSDDAIVAPPPPTAPQPVDSPRSFWPWTSPSANASPASSLPKNTVSASPALSAPIASSLPVPASSKSRIGAPPGSGSAGLPPSTPGLDPSLPDDDDDDDWEHVCAVEDDHIVGELELDDEYSVENQHQKASQSSYATIASVKT